MSAIDDGGQAFPNRRHLEYGGSVGMSLRDYFAAKAMQGELAATNEGLPVGFDAGNLSTLAAHWYRIADAMIAARKK